METMPVNVTVIWRMNRSAQVGQQTTITSSMPSMNQVSLPFQSTDAQAPNVQGEEHFQQTRDIRLEL